MIGVIVQYLPTMQVVPENPVAHVHVNWFCSLLHEAPF